jgi:TRAP-type C4-dicarboxylate transport system, large permease component
MSMTKTSVLVKSAMTSAVILFLTGLATLFCWIMTIEGTSRMLQGFVTSANINKYVFLLIINLIYLVLGMLMDTIPIIILTTPIFLPIAVSFGIDPIHFGTITVVNLAFGLFTPPFGVCVFMANTYSKQPVAGIFSQCRYFFVFGLIGIFLTTYFPQIYMWVVR